MIAHAGPFATPLAILTALMAVLIFRTVRRSRAAPDRAGAEVNEGRAAILFWGFVAAVLGFLGQCAALYQIMTMVVDAEAINPELMAEGFAASFATTLWGVGLLLVAGIAWLSLQWLGRARRSIAALTVLSLAGVIGCSSNSSPAPEDITQGAWAGRGGEDTFLFELQGTPPDSLMGIVHVMNSGKMTSELPITRASYHAPDLEMFIARTNVTYRGRVDVSRGRISGGLSYGGEPGPEMELSWTDLTEIPCFAGLPGDTPYAYRQPADGVDGWQTATPEDVGIDRGAVEALVNAVAQGEGGLIHSLTIVRNGKLVVDEYFHGYTPDDVHRLASTTKSVSSLLVGAAIDRGLISGVDVPIPQLLGEAADASWDKATLAHLLTMSMGLDWTPEEANSVHGTGRTFFQRVLNRKVATPPGTRWDYVSANVNLLAGAIYRATGKHADMFAGEVLFSPLGIDTYDWEYAKEGGHNLMDGSLHLRPRDLAKIGTMVAAGGRWHGEQVISEEWIEESTRTHMTTGELPALGGYGYLWWTGEVPTGHGNEPIVVANGWGSQFVIIFPQLEVVVVTTGGNEDNGRTLDVGKVLARTLLSSM
jgi:CubicO group peptidase (beta-lactamase class C family)